MHLHSLSLLRSCTQKAVSLLRDTGKKTSRSVDRMNILFGLLGGDPRWIRGQPLYCICKVLMKIETIRNYKLKSQIHVYMNFQYGSRKCC